MPGRTQHTDAVLLRAVDYGDADRVVTLLTRDLGKVSLIARGARRSKRRFAGSLEPMCVIRAEIGSGRGELGRLAQAHVHRAHPGLLSSLTKMRLAGAGLELVREATPARAPDERVFEATLRLLEALEAIAPDRAAALLVAFEVRLLALVGFAAGLDTCASCGKRAPAGQAAMFDPKLGSVVCRACGGGPLRLSGSTRERLSAALGGDWTEVGEPWSEQELDEAARMLEELIAHHLGRRVAGHAVLTHKPGAGETT